MRPQKIDDSELMWKLFEVLRSKGYAGTSLNDLAEAAGLKKASLYHRFPNGKEEITLTVLAYSREIVDNTILDVLKDSGKEPEIRLKVALKNISKFYDQGKKTCLTRALSTEKDWPILTDLLKTGSEKWIHAFQTIAIDLGFDIEVVEDMALDTIIRIQGSLLISNYLDSVLPFKKTLRKIEKLYLKK